MALDSLRDGFVRLCFDPSANLLGTRNRMVLEGQAILGGVGAVAADTLVKVTSPRDVDTMFGEGSVLAESLKVATECCGNLGVEIMALPREDAAGAVAAVYEWTVTGPATTDGRVDIYMGEARYNISVRVRSGDTAADIAAAIATAISTSFPYTVTHPDPATGVLVLTARNGGTVGNFLNAELNWHGRNGYLPEGVDVTFAQTTVGATDPARLAYDAIFGECCVAAFGLLGGDDDWQDGIVDHLADAWSCDKPQCFGHGYTYNAGTLGQVLASDTNSATLSRMAHGTADPIFPWFRVAAYVAQSACRTADNPEISIEGPQFGILDCVKHPESCTNAWTFDEQEQLRESGFVVTVPVSAGEGALTSPMVTNDVTNNRYDAEGRENLTFQSVASRRLATETARQISEELQAFQGLGYYTSNTNIREGAQGVNKNLMLGTMRAWVRSKVGVLFSEFDDLNADLTFTDDFETAPRCQGIPGKVAMNLKYRPPVRLRQVVVNAAPELMNNC